MKLFGSGGMGKMNMRNNGYAWIPEGDKFCDVIKNPVVGSVGKTTNCSVPIP